MGQLAGGEGEGTSEGRKKKVRDREKKLDGEKEEKIGFCEGTLEQEWETKKVEGREEKG